MSAEGPRTSGPAGAAFQGRGRPWNGMFEGAEHDVYGRGTASAAEVRRWLAEDAANLAAGRPTRLKGGRGPDLRIYARVP